MSIAVTLIFTPIISRLTMSGALTSGNGGAHLKVAPGSGRMATANFYGKGHNLTNTLASPSSISGMVKP